MNVPEVIDRGNTAFLAVARDMVRDGKTVIVAYDGVHAVGYKPFDTKEAAMEALPHFQAQVASSPSAHFKVLFPDGSEIAASRPQLLDGEPDDPVLSEGPADAPGGPQLSAEQEGKLQVAVAQRDRAATALQAAAFAFAKAQDECTALAEELRKSVEAQLNGQNPPVENTDGKTH